MIYTRDYDIDNTGVVDVTKKLQELIDEAQGDAIYIDKGKYLVSNLYIKSNTEFVMDPNAYLIGTTEEDKYDIISTRVAGINMDWYPAILNVIGQEHVIIKGGHIIGAGDYFYNKYWGTDKKGGMRKEYDSKGLRWACDYDCMRVRNMLISDSEYVTVKDIELRDSGFWNLHLLYSSKLIIDHIKVVSDNENAPSTDGIDIDSCHQVLIINCNISTNDDSISIKSGRDYDGFLCNRPSYNITIKNCDFYKGYGIAFGSELSAGIYDINVDNVHFYKTDAAIRIKSSKTRKGFVKNVNITNIVALDVKYLFHFNLNWNTEYSVVPKLPKKLMDIKPHYLFLTREIKNEPNTRISNIRVDGVQSEVFESRVSRIFTLLGFEDSQMESLSFKHMNVQMKEYGIVKNVANMQVNKSLLNYDTEYIKKNDDFDNR